MSVGSLPKRETYGERVEAAAEYYRYVVAAQNTLKTVNARMQAMLDELSAEEFEQWKAVTVWTGGK